MESPKGLHSGMLVAYQTRMATITAVNIYMVKGPGASAIKYFTTIFNSIAQKTCYYSYTHVGLLKVGGREKDSSLLHSAIY